MFKMRHEELKELALQATPFKPVLTYRLEFELLGLDVNICLN